MLNLILVWKKGHRQWLTGLTTALLLFVSLRVACNLHLPFNISFNGKITVKQNGDSQSFHHTAGFWGLTSFSEWMKMTYDVGLHESNSSPQGYPVKQCFVWFRNCSLADLRQDRGWRCALGLMGRMLHWQTAASLLPDSASDNRGNTNAIRCRRCSARTSTHTQAMSVRGYLLGKK